MHAGGKPEQRSLEKKTSQTTVHLIVTSAENKIPNGSSWRPLAVNGGVTQTTQQNHFIINCNSFKVNFSWMNSLESSLFFSQHISGLFVLYYFDPHILLNVTSLELMCQILPQLPLEPRKGQCQEPTVWWVMVMWQDDSTTGCMHALNPIFPPHNRERDKLTYFLTFERCIPTDHVRAPGQFNPGPAQIPSLSWV